MEITLLDKSDVENGWMLSMPTDLALLANVFNDGNYGDFWTKTIKNNYFYAVRENDRKRKYEIRLESPTFCSSSGVRPVLEFDERSFKPFMGKEEVLYGEYPQTVVNLEKQKEIEEMLDFLPKTGKSYMLRLNTFDGYYQENFSYYPEYYYQKKKYILVHTYPDYDIEELSNGRTVIDGKYLIEVEPICFLVDESKKRLISKKILVGGVSLMPIVEKKEVLFENTEMYSYLHDVMINEIIPSAYYSHILEDDPRLQEYFLVKKGKQYIKEKK